MKQNLFYLRQYFEIFKYSLVLNLRSRKCFSVAPRLTNFSGFFLHLVCQQKYQPNGCNYYPILHFSFSPDKQVLQDEILKEVYKHCLKKSRNRTVRYTITTI